MSALLGWVQGNRPRAYGIAVVLVGWLTLVGVPDLIQTGVLTILGILLGTDVHNSVTPVTKAAEAVREAAHESATATAKNLTKDTVGVGGTLTLVGEQVADQTASSVASGTLQAIGIQP